MNAFKRNVSLYARRRQKRKLTKHLSAGIAKRIGFLVFVVIALIGMNTAGMMAFEGKSFEDALWLSMVTIVTVGYGDLYPQTIWGRITIVLSMFILGISVLTSLVSEIIEWRLVVGEKKRKGFWVWKKMKNQIQIINAPNHDAERYLSRLLSEISITKQLKDSPVHLISRKFPNGLPQSLVKKKLLHTTGVSVDSEVLQQSNIEQASNILVLARDQNDDLSDSVTFDVLSQLRSLCSKPNIVVEAVSDHNYQRFIDAGANVVIRPIRAYPEMVVRSMVHPGTEKIIEDLLDAKGDSLHREDINFKDKTWIEIVTSALTIGCGTPIAYVSKGNITLQPEAQDICSGDSIILISKQDNTEKVKLLSKQLA